MCWVGDVAGGFSQESVVIEMGMSGKVCAGKGLWQKGVRQE